MSLPLQNFEWKNVATDEGNMQNKIYHWTKDEIGVAVESWLWAQVELMAWELKLLGRLNQIHWSWVQILLRSTLYSYFQESFSGKYHIYEFILLHTCDYFYRISIK